MTRAHFADGEIRPAQWEAARVAALREIDPVRSRIRDLGWEQAVGASGTVRAVGAVARAAGWIDEGISPKALRRLRGALLEAGRVDRLRLPGLSARRRNVFPGGVVVLSAIFEALGIDRLTISDGALREGLLVDLCGRIREQDARSRSVAALGDRYHVDRKQAARVETTARALLGRVATFWGLDTIEARQMLSWSAQLHEVGLDIAHASYHRHGEYIVRESDLLGFSRDEQLLLATLVRAHRRKFPSDAIEELPHRRRVVQRLAILLRLAVAIHRSRSPEAPPQFELQAEKRSLHLRFADGWLETHPLLRADLEAEANYLAAEEFTLEFDS